MCGSRAVVSILTSHQFTDRSGKDPVIKVLSGVPADSCEKCGEVYFTNRSAEFMEAASGITREEIQHLRIREQGELARQRNYLLHDLREARLALQRCEPNIEMALRRIRSLEEFCETAH